VRAITPASYAQMHTRICRPVGLKDEDLRHIVDYAIARIGQQYDLKNIFDLVRYLFPIAPVPTRFRRHLLALGSGDPTRAICSILMFDLDCASVSVGALSDIAGDSTRLVRRSDVR